MQTSDLRLILPFDLISVLGLESLPWTKLEQMTGPGSPTLTHLFPSLQMPQNS